MPGGFNQGLASGLLGGWTKAQEQQDEIKRSERGKELDRYIKIATSGDLPDDTREWALGQMQSTIQGKKPGSKQAGGPLSPILQKLSQMIGASHGQQGGAQAPPQQQQGGMTENMPNGQPAPGTAGSTGQLPQIGTRPTLAKPEPGQPEAAGSSAPPQASTTDRQIDNLRQQLSQTHNPFTKQRLQDRIDSIMDAQAKGEAAAEVARIRADAQRDVAEANRQRIEETQRIRDSDSKEKATEIANLNNQFKKEQQERDENFKKQLEAARATHQEELKKTVPGKATGTGKPAKQVFDKIEDAHQSAYQRLNTQYSARVTAANKLAGSAKTRALAEAEKYRKSQSDLIEQDYKQKINRATGNAGDGGSDRVTVISPDGKKGTIPRSQLPEAKSQGYKEAA